MRKESCYICMPRAWQVFLVILKDDYKRWAGPVNLNFSMPHSGVQGKFESIKFIIIFVANLSLGSSNFVSCQTETIKL